ncbi:MAG: transketolase C-terminal domain-containing protein [candidate division Zixibacteria bacterium]|nr:transketolase C-terminal domain-containing protein [candidate division Zixibacteria bacterium]
MKKVIEGSMAVAEAVKVCRPHVISAYPITPQTHIVENLSQFVADGDLKSQFVNVESEFGAASVILGASATGARAYSTTTSQGLLLMTEVLFNIAGLRFPVVITCTNRAVSAPINIWNDQQDVMTIRDSGWILLFAEDNQEAADMHLQAFKIGEHPEIMLPVMVNMDGFILTHAFEPIEFIDQKMADEFLPPYKPELYLTTKNPLTFGILAEPDWYMETRYRLQKAIEASSDMIEEVADQFKKTFGRYQGGLVEKYRLDGAETVIVSMGSVVGTIKEVADELRDKGKKVGVLKIRAFRPFPKEAIYDALKNVKNVIVMEKAISLGATGILYDEIKAALYGKPSQPKISGFIAGLGGRDIPKESIMKVIEKGEAGISDNVFVDLKENLIGGK